MRAIGGEEGGADVTADLCSVEYTCLAAACFALQRGRGAIPALMPALHCSSAASDGVASSECREAVSGGVRSVLQEDVMLGLGAEMRHGCVESEPAGGRTAVRQARWDGAKTGLSHAALPHERTNSSRVKPT